MNKALKFILGLVWAAMISAPTLAHSEAAMADSFENKLGAFALRLVLGASVALGLLSFVSGVIGKRGRKKLAPRLFGLMITLIAVVTIFLIGSTIYLNNISYTKGPVHWHADFEIWKCGKPVLSHNKGEEVDELRDPHGFLSNKIGSPTIHEHNDRRMHIEGVLVDKHEASLGTFFVKIGGDLHKDLFVFPTNEGKISYKNGQNCPNGPGIVQIFVHSIKDKKVIQTKLSDPENYVISAQGAVPPGDCVIIEFDTPKDKTDKLCLSYQVAKQTGKAD